MFFVKRINSQSDQTGNYCLLTTELDLRLWSLDLGHLQKPYDLYKETPDFNANHHLHVSMSVPPSRAASRLAGATGRPNHRLARQPDRQRAHWLAGRHPARQLLSRRPSRWPAIWLSDCGTAVSLVNLRAGRLAVQPAGSPGSWLPGLPVGRAAGPPSAVRHYGKHTV